MSADICLLLKSDCSKNEYLPEKRSLKGQGHYQPTYQQARKGFIYLFYNPLINFYIAIEPRDSIFC